MTAQPPAFHLAEDGVHVTFTHDCPAHAWQERPHGRVTTNLPVGDRGWQVAQREPLTVTPSILCRGCGLHGFITEGTWRPA